MGVFVEMRHFIAGNALLFERIERVELKQPAYQKEIDEKFERIFPCTYVVHPKIFFNGQIYDFFGFLIGLIQKAVKDIILIDGYVDIETLIQPAKTSQCWFGNPHIARLTVTEVATLNRQSPPLPEITTMLLLPFPYS